MKEVPRAKRLAVAQYYLLGHTYSDIEARTGVSHGSIVNTARAHFEGGVDFEDTQLSDTTLRAAEFGGTVYPPKSITGNVLALDWDQVRGTVPFLQAAHCYAGWESLLTAGGLYGEARRVHRAWVRHEMALWLWLWLVVLLAVAFCFVSRYYRRFGPVPRGSRLRHFRRALLFSLDVLSPGIGAYRYDWEPFLEVKKAVVLTSVESIIGWILLGAGATIRASWLVA